MAWYNVSSFRVCAFQKKEVFGNYDSSSLMDSWSKSLLRQLCQKNILSFFLQDLCN